MKELTFRIGLMSKSKKRYYCDCIGNWGMFNYTLEEILDKIKKEVKNGKR